jgi:ABC-type branched-subunit amino acid transport system substrate-binding protein
LPVLALASVLTLAGCTTGAARSGAHPKPGRHVISSTAHPKPRKVITGTGVTRTDITLGALIDYAGPFADSAIAVLHGQEIWIKETNAASGVCGRKIKLETRDDRGAAGQAKAQYTSLEPTVLGFMQIQGSSAAATLSQSLIDNETTAVTLSNSSELLGNLSVVSSSVPFSAAVPKAAHVASAYQQARYPELPSSGVPYGYAIASLWGQLLKRACTNGDLSRSGIQEALQQLNTISTDNLIADLSFAKPGFPATRQAYVGLPDPAVPGGIRQVSPLFESPEAHGYVAPRQGTSKVGNG